MTDKVVSLSKKRKERSRTAKKQRATENAVKFGRTKAQKDADKAETARIARLFDAHKQDRDT